MTYFSLTGRCLLVSAAVFWLCSIAMLSWAGETPVTGAGLGKTGRFTQSYDWYEGERRNTVWLNPGLIAEFHAGAAQESPISALYPDALLLDHPGAHIRIWRLPGGIDSGSVLESLNSGAEQAVKYSPVFHDAPSPASRMRALPGNIIVYFNPEWDKKTISQWVAAHELLVVHQLASGSPAYVLKTGPGLEALELANTLHETDGVNAAFPDWWHETVTR